MSREGFRSKNRDQARAVRGRFGQTLSPGTPEKQPHWPTKLGPYLIRGRLGGGSMGEVWRAYDPDLDRELAIKMWPEHAKDPDYAARFLREARTAAKLHHPNTVTVHQVGTDGGTVYIAMELIDGPSLADDLQKQGCLPWAEATHVVREAAAGLAAAHESGLVHRDLKPTNLMRTSKGLPERVASRWNRRSRLRLG